MANTHQTAKTQYVSVGPVKYAYRRFGLEEGTPVLFLIHFRGTMDFWDPLLINNIAKTRSVILFDNAGVGQSSGEVANTIAGMAQHAIVFLEAIGVDQVDVFGFSMGGYVAPMVALNGPKGLVRRLVIAGSGPSYGEDLAVQPEERTKMVGEWAGQPRPNYDNCFSHLFFSPNDESQKAGQAWWARVHERDATSSGESRSDLVSTDYKDGGKGIKAMLAAAAAFSDPEQRAYGSYDRLSELTMPILVANGHDDFMIPTPRSFTLQQRLPRAWLKVFPRAGHGFLYQYAEEFAGDVNRFLDAEL